MQVVLTMLCSFSHIACAVNSSVQLQNLVEQMKEGFIQAMEELSLIQDGDKILRQKVDDNKEEVDRKIEELGKLVHQLKVLSGRCLQANWCIN